MERAAASNVPAAVYVRGILGRRTVSPITVVVIMIVSMMIIALPKAAGRDVISQTDAPSSALLSDTSSRKGVSK